MEIALYVRVSTNRQQQKQTIEQQIERLKARVATMRHNLRKRKRSQVLQTSRICACRR